MTIIDCHTSSVLLRYDKLCFVILTFQWCILYASKPRHDNCKDCHTESFIHLPHDVSKPRYDNLKHCHTEVKIPYDNAYHCHTRCLIHIYTHCRNTHNSIVSSPSFSSFLVINLLVTLFSSLNRLLVTDLSSSKPL